MGTHMAKLTRSGSQVVFTQPGFTVRCSMPYGGAPLEMYQTDNINHPVLVTSSPAGEGFQALWNSGQDGTQSSSNGQDANPMQPLIGPYLPGGDYWGREEAFLPDRDGREAVHQVSGKAPYFWASLDPEDDCLPPDPRGDHGWSTKYHDILNLGASAYHQIGTPIFFKYTQQVPSGIILMGNEMIPPVPSSWWQRGAPIPGGHCSGRMYISLKHADASAVAAIWFGIDAAMDSTETQATIYNSPKCGIYVNKQGGVEYHDGGAVTHIGFNALSDVNSEDGLYIEWRDFADRLELRLGHGGFLVSARNSVKGPYMGFFTTGGSGYAKFHYRDIFDAGTEFVQQIRTTPRNTIITDYKIYRTRAPWWIPMYRLNMPVAYVEPSLREVVRIWQGNSEYPPNPSGICDLDLCEMIYAGKASGTAGLMCKVLSYSGLNSHVGFSPAHISLSGVPYEANTFPVMINSATMVSEWAPKFRSDFLDYVS